MYSLISVTPTNFVSIALTKVLAPTGPAKSTMAIPHNALVTSHYESIFISIKTLARNNESVK